MPTAKKKVHTLLMLKSNQISNNPSEKLYQAELIHPNKQMSPTRIEIIVWRPTGKYSYNTTRDHNRVPTKKVPTKKVPTKKVSPITIDIILELQL